MATNIQNPKRVLTKESLVWIWNKVKAALNSKVDKVTGKSLSTNDYTNADKTKLQSLSSDFDIQIPSTVETTYTYVNPKITSNHRVRQTTIVADNDVEWATLNGSITFSCVSGIPAMTLTLYKPE